MTAPMLRRRPSFWIGLLATMLIVGLWARSVGRYEGVEWTRGSGDWWCAGLYHRGFILASVPEVELPTGRADFSLSSGPADLALLDPREEAALITPPVRVWVEDEPGSTGFEISIAWWFILALHLTCWAAVMACLRHRRIRAASPAPGFGKAHPQ